MSKIDLVNMSKITDYIPLTLMSAKSSNWFKKSFFSSCTAVRNIDQSKEIFSKILDDEISNKMPLDIIEETKKNFDEAIELAESNLEFDYMFMTLIANAKYQQGNYLDVVDWSNKFKDMVLNDQRDIPEDIMIRSFMRLISSLFNLQKYEELVKLEPEFNNYIKERKRYNELLAMTNFYFGVSYINLGDIQKGAYYLGLAAKNSNSKAESDYIDTVIDKISSYL